MTSVETQQERDESTDLDRVVFKTPRVKYSFGGGFAVLTPYARRAAARRSGQAAATIPSLHRRLCQHLHTSGLGQEIREMAFTPPAVAAVKGTRRVELPDGSATSLW